MRCSWSTKRWILGKRDCNQNKQLGGHAGKYVTNTVETVHQKVDFGETKLQKNKQLYGHAGKCVTNAMETAHQKVDSGETKLK